MPHKGHLSDAAIQMLPTPGAVAVVRGVVVPISRPPSLPLVVAFTTGPAFRETTSYILCQLTDRGRGLVIKMKQ